MSIRDDMVDFTPMREVQLWVKDSDQLARQLYRVSEAAQRWDGHKCSVALATRNDTYAPCEVRVTGRQVRTFTRFGTTTYRVSALVTFAFDEDRGQVPVELIFKEPVELDAVKALFR